MKSEKNIFIAFILNLFFSIFELVGGFITGSVAIVSDSIHDLGDAASIGISFFLERKSKKQPDVKYTYGYTRYSVLGGLITTLILFIGSALVIYNAVQRIISPTPINYDGMIVFAVVGVIVNLCAAMFTRDGHSINQRAVNLHMLEDVLGWIVVLVGAVIMRFTDFYIIDPVMSICVAVFIFINAIKNLGEILNLFLEKTPEGIDVDEIKEHILTVDDVVDVHHVHVRSVDGQNNYATMHIVVKSHLNDFAVVKRNVREELREHGICHATLEIEYEDEDCEEKECHVEIDSSSHHHHHHHHHGGHHHGGHHHGHKHGHGCEHEHEHEHGHEHCDHEHSHDDGKENIHGN